MARQINVRAILRAAAVVCIVAGLSIIIGRIVHAIALGNALGRAQALAQQKEYDKAAELCKVHLDRHDKDKGAWLLYADLLVKATRAPLAAEAYRRVLDLDPRSYDATLWLTRFNLALAMGPPGGAPPPDASARWRQVESLATNLTKLAPEKTDGYQYLARAQTNLGKPEGEATLKNLIKKYPKEEQAYFDLAELAERRGAPVAEWRRFIDNCVKQNPKSWSAHLAAYRIFAARDIAGAEKHLEAALSIAPEEPTVIIQAAVSRERSARTEDLKENTEAAAKHWDAARAYWQKLRSSAPSDPRAYAALARIELLHGSSDDAISILRDGLKKSKMPEELMLRYQLTEFLIATGGRGEAFEELDRLKESAPGSPWTVFLEGYGFLAQGKVETARSLLERAARGLPDVFQVHLVLGSCYLELGEPGLAKAEFLTALNQNPSSVDVRIFLARSLMECGEHAAAVDEAKKATEAQPKRQDAWLVLAQALGSVTGTDGHPVQQSLQQAIKAAQTAVQLRASAEALILLARLYDAADKRTEAESTLKKEPADAKNVNRLKVELVRFYRAKGEVEKGKQAYDELFKTAGEATDARLLALELSEQPQPEAIEKELLSTIAKAPGKEAASARQTLASFYLRQGNRDKAIEQFKAIAAADRENVAVCRTLFRMALDSGRYDDAKKLLTEITRISGDDSPSAICDAAEYEILLSGRKAPLETFLKVQEKLEKVCQTTPSTRAFIILGDANRLGGRLAEAIRSYQRALEANPRMVTVGAALIGALNEAGRFQEADLELGRLAKVAPSSSIVLDLQFDRLRREGDLNGAISVKKQELDLRPNDATTLIEYAQLLRLKSDTAGAEEALRKACKLAPDSPTAVSTLAFFLRGTSRQAEGLKLCDDFVAARGTKKEAFITRAQYHRASGDTKKAADDLQKALKLDPKDKGAIIALGDIAWQGGDQKEGMAYYRKAAALEPPESYARKTVVERLAGTGKPADFAEAQTIAGKVLQEEEEKGTLADPEAFLLKANLDTQNIETLEQAKKNCQRAIELAPNSAAPHIMLSLIAQAGGDGRKASDEASRALAIEPRSPRGVMLNVDMLRRERRFREARVVLDKLQEESPAVIIARADLLASESGPAPAADSLKKAIAALRPEAPAAAKVPLLLRLARYLEEAGNNTEVEAQLRAAYQLVPDSLEALGALARFLDKQKRSSETDQLLDRAAKGMTGQPLASLKMLRADLLLARRDAKSIADAERLANEALALNPSSSLALRILGDASYAAKQPKQAIDHYRKALELDFRNSFAANNLAWVLCEGGKAKEALPYARNAVFLSPMNPSFLDTLGEICYQLGDYQRSESVLSRCVDVSPDAAGSHVRIAKANLKLGKLDDAERAIAKAAEADQRLRNLSPEQRGEITKLREQVNLARKASSR